jgi:coenzyme F420 biosynthesis associated uncharacterized protein
MDGAPDFVDWDLAAATGTRLVRPGPQIPAAQARAAVEQLRAFAVEARGHVRAYTGLDAPSADAPVAVVDRQTWVRSNAAGLRHLFEPLAKSLPVAGIPAPLRAAGSRITGLEAGAGLAFLAGKVLGQYELFPPGGPDGDRPGRLLLVAPNIVQVETELGVDPADFRLWVCIHEETHRVQFGAVPWLRDHIVAQVGAMVATAGGLGGVGGTGLGDATDRGRQVVAAVSAALRGQPGPSLAEAIQSPEQKAVLDEVTAVMSLLEGHADVVMDGVGPGVIGSVEKIRQRFQQRREEPTRVDAAMRRLLGLDAKLRQYREGAQFVRGVVDQVGMDGFNRVWESAQTLPRSTELADPAAWVARVSELPPPGVAAAGVEDPGA